MSDVDVFQSGNVSLHQNCHTPAQVTSHQWLAITGSFRIQQSAQCLVCFCGYRNLSTRSITVEWPGSSAKCWQIQVFVEVNKSKKSSHADRHCEIFSPFTELRRDFGPLLLILNTIIHGRFAAPTLFIGKFSSVSRRHEGIIVDLSQSAMLGQQGQQTQTQRNLLGFYRTEEGFCPDFADIKPDYTQEFYRSYSSFSAKNVWGPFSFAVSAGPRVSPIRPAACIVSVYCINVSEAVTFTAVWSKSLIVHTAQRHTAQRYKCANFGQKYWTITEWIGHEVNLTCKENCLNTESVS